jgi:release factor glutamine methyltransferase
MNNSNIKKHQEDFLNKAKARKTPVNFNVEGIDVVVNPGVFPPATDTKLLVANIHTKKGERIIDLTTGSGSAAIAAGLQGASGLAADINPEAVKNANQNFKKHNVQIEVIESNLFEAVPPEYFDQMFANGPFFEGYITDPMDYACYGARMFIESLFSGLKNYLKIDGKLLIVMSAWSDLEHFKKTSKKNGLKTKMIATRKSDDKERTYHLYEVKIS